MQNSRCRLEIEANRCDAGNFEPTLQRLLKSLMLDNNVDNLKIENRVD